MYYYIEVVMKHFSKFIQENYVNEQVGRKAAIAAAVALAPGIAYAGDHTVKSGDTLSALAQKYGTTVEDLAKRNKIADPNKIQIGQTINFADKKKTTAPKAAPKATPEVAPKSADNCPYGQLCVDLQRAETGSEKDPFIRTRHRPKGGSTAFGPGQITGTTLRDMYKRHSSEFTEVKDYMGTLIDQSKEFAKYGAEPNKPGYEARFDYGGSGDPAAKDPEKYLIVQKGVLRGMAKDLFGEAPDTLSSKQREDLIKRWRDATAEEDPRYHKEVNKGYTK